MRISKLNTHPAVKPIFNWEFKQQLAKAIESKRNPSNTDTFSISDGGSTVTVQTKEFHEFEFPDDTHAYHTLMSAWSSMDIDPITLEINLISTETSYMVVFNLKLINP